MTAIRLWSASALAGGCPGLLAGPSRSHRELISEIPPSGPGVGVRDGVSRSQYHADEPIPQLLAVPGTSAPDFRMRSGEQDDGPQEPLLAKEHADRFGHCRADKCRSRGRSAHRLVSANTRCSARRLWCRRSRQQRRRCRASVTRASRSRTRRLRSGAAPRRATLPPHVSAVTGLGVQAVKEVSAGTWAAVSAEAPRGGRPWRLRKYVEKSSSRRRIPSDRSRRSCRVCASIASW